MGSLTDKPRSYQLRGRDFILKNKTVYVANDMGLGKTATVIFAIQEIQLPTLVVAPIKVAHDTWPEEIKKWGSGLSYEILYGPGRLAKVNSKALIHIINYEGLTWLYEELHRRFKAKKPLRYRVLVLDESTFIKSPDSKRFNCLKSMIDLFDYRINLSGTPCPQSLMELWAQYYILDKGAALGDNFNDFRDKNFTRDAFRKYHWATRPGAEDDIYRAIAPITFRLSDKDYSNLPERIFSKLALELPPKEREMYRAFKKDFVLLLESATVKSLNSASLSSKLRQFIQGAVYENKDNGERITHFIHDHKTSALKELLEGLHGRNALCLIQFKFEADALLKAFPGTPCVTGSTSTSLSNKYIGQWKAGELPLLITHPRSIGRGLNLQSGGDVVIWYALPWSLDDYLQTNKRLHRPGQMNPVLIQHIIFKNTIDEHVLAALNTNEMTQERLLEFLRKKTQEEDL